MKAISKSLSDYVILVGCQFSSPSFGAWKFNGMEHSISLQIFRTELTKHGRPINLQIPGDLIYHVKVLVAVGNN